MVGGSDGMTAWCGMVDGTASSVAWHGGWYGKLSGVAWHGGWHEARRRGMVVNVVRSVWL